MGSPPTPDAELAARLAAIVESSDDAIVSKTLDGVITSWNAGAERIFGYSAAEAVGRSILLVIPPERRAEETHVLDCIQRGEPVDHFETVRLRKDGRRIPISLTVSPIRDAAGRIVGASKVARDISFQKQLETERAVLLEAAESANRMKDDFLAMFGHELRNPLAAISAAVELLDLARGPGDVAQPRAVIKRQVGHLQRLVDDLLDAARVRAGKIVLDRRRLDLGDAVDRALGVLHAGPFAPRHILDLRCTAVGVCADPVRLEQIILNLLSNAVKYTPAGKRIQVTVRAEGAQALLRVEDEGIGIPAHLKPHIFELFVQGENSLDRSQAGLGIGLNLVRTLTELHGGAVEAESRGPGMGSAFTVRLPRLSLEDVKEALPPLVAAARAHRILIVEDNEDAREMLGEFLRLQGHEVYEAVDGAEGVKLAIQHAPDVALVDLGLPLLDGYEVARHLRRQAVQPRRLIALSGYGQPEDRTRSLAAGFDDHIVKPIDLSRLAILLA